jgi:hypothetical protein
MTAIITTIQIERPAVEVFDYATDPTAFMSGKRGSSTDTWKLTACLLLGSQCLTTRRIGGANRS